MSQNIAEPMVSLTFSVCLGAPRRATGSAGPAETTLPIPGNDFRKKTQNLGGERIWGRDPKHLGGKLERNGNYVDAAWVLHISVP